MLADHPFLTNTDLCHYLGEYHPEGDFETPAEHRRIADNRLLHDFNIPPQAEDPSARQRKNRAIRHWAQKIKEALSDFAACKQHVFVSIPPPRIRTDEGYDDRMPQALRHALGEDGRIVELIVQRKSEPAAGPATAQERLPDLASIQANYFIDEATAELVSPDTAGIVLCDDLLATGAHFAAARNLLGETFPQVRIMGLFLTRQTRPGSQGMPSPRR